MKRILVGLVITLLVSQVNALSGKKEQQDAISVYGNLVSLRVQLKNAPPMMKPAIAPMVTVTEDTLKDLCKPYVYTGNMTSQNSVMESVKACYLGVGINKCASVKNHPDHKPYAGMWCRKQGL
jgi:hypothetical protein|tara:strand:- start:564 stop:932 length:369 start_codon:yes stop_codon:yes gene_type:complete